MSRKIILLRCFILTSFLTFAQSNKSKKQDSITKGTQLQEVVVTGTLFKIPVEKSGKTIYKLSAESIERNAGKSVVDILNEVPGIQMEGNFGSPGTNISTYVRGGRNKNVLILIDGIPLNDPSGISASYDLRLLPVSSIESIEVLKGGLSTLYGTGASAGVINIALKKNKEEPIGGSLDVNYGSYNTETVNGNINGKINKFSYMLSGNYSNSDGFSAASDENSPTEFKKDGFQQKNGLLKLGYKFNEAFKLDGVVGYDDFKSGYDAGAFADAENVQKGQLFRAGLIPTYTYAKGEVKLKALYASNKREFISSFPSVNNGQNLQLDLTNRHKINTELIGVWGVNSQLFSYEQEGVIDFEDTKFSIVDPYASLFFESKYGFNVHVGGRLNIHSEYDSKFVYNINPSYLFTTIDNIKLKLSASVASTYITPTGYQLFSSYGNPDLNPEESVNFEFGTSLYLGKSLVFNIAYFNRNEKSAIGFVSEFDGDGNFIGGAYQNLDTDREVNGVEMDLSMTVSDKVSFALNHTNVFTDEVSTFYRIPEDKWGASINVNPSKNSVINLKYNYTGERTIFDFASSNEIDLDSYGLFDIYAQQKLLDGKFVLYGALNNALDKDFVSIYGFTTRGRNYNIGVKYNF